LKDFHFPFGVFEFGDVSRLPCPKTNTVRQLFERDYTVSVDAVMKAIEAEKTRQLRESEN
jgi:hypothetical protein